MSLNKKISFFVFNFALIIFAHVSYSKADCGIDFSNSLAEVVSMPASVSLTKQDIDHVCEELIKRVPGPEAEDEINFHSEQGAEFSVWIYTDEESIKYFGNNIIIGSGVSKSLRKVYRFDSLLPVIPVALLSLQQTHMDSEIHKDQFRKEQKILKEKGNELGLIPWYGFASQKIFQKWISEDYLNFATSYQETIEVNLDILHSIAESISNLHSKGLVHNDIKPENVMLEFNRKDLKEYSIHTYIADFGNFYELPKNASEGRYYPILMGTLNYLAPERIGAGSIIQKYWKKMTYEEYISNYKKGDVYSLSATAFAVLKGSQDWLVAEDASILSPEAIEKLRVSRIRKIKEFRYAQHQIRDLNLRFSKKTLLMQLIAYGVHPDPNLRITIDQFKMGLEKIIKGENFDFGEKILNDSELEKEEEILRRKRKRPIELVVPNANYSHVQPSQDNI